MTSATTKAIRWRKAIRWLRVTRALLDAEPLTEEFRSLSQQALAHALKHLKATQERASDHQ
jgi:hypothetical protein